MTHTYAAVERALTRLHGDTGPAALRISARVKHFIRLGFTPDSPGKGQRISYTFEDVAKWAFGLEILEFGLGPAAMVDVISGLWPIAHPEAIRVGQHGLLVAMPATLSDPAGWTATACITDRAGLHTISAAWPGRLMVIDLEHLYARLANALDEGISNAA